MTEPLDWIGSEPRSRRFDDIYFSPSDGLAESRAVFLQGCGLPDAWAGRQSFVVGELGFGTGLNILALIELWSRTRPDPAATLHVFSVEAFPIAQSDAARALAGWPELAVLAAPLLTAWPNGRRGFHRIEWPEHGVILDLAIMEAQAALAVWSGFADAWFLDGFAPAKNPQMWRPELLALVAACSKPGARAATFSVAGAVRRGLVDAGFEIQRAPGFGRKKERLEARLPVSDTDRAPISEKITVAVIGAGIAGAALARAFHRLGCTVTVFDAEGVGAGASGNPAALVTPRFDAGLGANAVLHAQAFSRAVDLYRQETPHAILMEGAIQCATQPRDAARFDKICEWDGYDEGALTLLDEAAVAAALQEREASQGVYLRDALTIEPKLVLQSWLPGECVRTSVHALEHRGETWRLLDEEGQALTETDIVCLSAGPFTTHLHAGAPLRAVRGQVTFADTAFLGLSASFGGYAIPTGDGLLFGATHDRDDWSIEARPQDDARNLQALRQGRPALADVLAAAPLSARASLRAMTHDYLPLAGAVPGEAAGLFVLSGLGGRGFALAPLLAEALAAQALNLPSPLPRTLTAIVDPGRFEKS